MVVVVTCPQATFLPRPREESKEKRRENDGQDRDNAFAMKEDENNAMFLYHMIYIYRTVRARGVHQDVTRRVRVLPVAPYILGRSVSLPPLPSGLALRVFETGRVVPKARTSSCLFPPFLSLPQFRFFSLPFLSFLFSLFSLFLPLSSFHSSVNAREPRYKSSSTRVEAIKSRVTFLFARISFHTGILFGILFNECKIYMEFSEIDILLDFCSSLV